MHDMFEGIASSTEHAYKYMSHLFHEDSEGNKVLKGAVASTHELLTTLRQTRDYLLTHKENSKSNFSEKTSKFQRELNDHSNNIENQYRGSNL